jgi:hypothetical protein
MEGLGRILGSEAEEPDGNGCQSARVKVVVACFMQPVAVFLMLANAFERSSRAQG